MRMQCKTFAAKANIQWKYYNSSDKTKGSAAYLYNGVKVSNHALFGDFTIDESAKNCRDLEISKSKFENAGIYECVILVHESDRVKSESSSSAELVVLGRLTTKRFVRLRVYCRPIYISLYHFELTLYD